MHRFEAHTTVLSTHARTHKHMSVQMSASSATAQPNAQCHRVRCARTLLRAYRRGIATRCTCPHSAPSLLVARGDGISRQDGTRSRNGHEPRPFRRTPGPVTGPHNPCGTRNLLLSPRLVAVQHVPVKLRPADDLELDTAGRLAAAALLLQRSSR